VRTFTVKSGPAEFPRCFWLYQLIPRPPHFPAHGRLLVHFGGYKLVLDQVIGQPELLIPLILRRVTNKDLPVSRVRVDVVVFSIPLHQRHFIWRERLEMLLPLRSVSDDRSEACSREQVLCLLRISAANSVANSRAARLRVARAVA